MDEANFENFRAMLSKLLPKATEDEFHKWFHILDRFSIFEIQTAINLHLFGGDQCELKPYSFHDFIIDNIRRTGLKSRNGITDNAKTNTTETHTNKSETTSAYGAFINFKNHLKKEGQNG